MGSFYTAYTLPIQQFDTLPNHLIIVMQSSVFRLIQLHDINALFFLITFHNIMFNLLILYHICVLCRPCCAALMYLYSEYYSLYSLLICYFFTFLVVTKVKITGSVCLKVIAWRLFSGSNRTLPHIATQIQHIT